nr:protein ROOT HAIR DEFECTIVE 3-like [Ipomoea trifida]
MKILVSQNALGSSGNIRYEVEVTFFDEGVRSAKRKQLEETLLQAHNGKSAISKFVIRSMLENQSNV